MKHALLGLKSVKDALVQKGKGKLDRTSSV